jgi:hypothetical protein
MTTTVWSYSMRRGGRSEAPLNWRMGAKVAVLTEEARSAVALWCKIDGDCSASATGAGQADSPTWGSCPGFLLVARSGCARGNRRGGGLAASLHRNRGEKGGRRGAGPAWACHVEKKRRRQRGARCTWCSCWVSRQNVATAATTTVGWCNWAGERALGAGGFGWMKTVRGPAVWTRLDEQ